MSEQALLAEITEVVRRATAAPKLLEAAKAAVADCMAAR